jgi:hypothetical protein
MDDLQFQSWMRRMAAVNKDAQTPNADEIWWRARLRQRLNTEKRATRPIRIAEGAATAVCWLAATVVLAGLGPGGLLVFVTIAVAIVVGLRAITPRSIRSARRPV